MSFARSCRGVTTLLGTVSAKNVLYISLTNLGSEVDKYVLLSNMHKAIYNYSTNEPNLKILLLGLTEVSMFFSEMSIHQLSVIYFCPSQVLSLFAGTVPMRRWCPCCRAAGRCPLWLWRRVRLTTPQTKPTQRNLQAWPPPRYHAPGQYTPTNLTFCFGISNSSWSAWTNKVTSDPSVNCLCVLNKKAEQSRKSTFVYCVLK